MTKMCSLVHTWLLNVGNVFIVHQICRLCLFMVSEGVQCVEYLQNVSCIVRSVKSEDWDLTCFEDPMFHQTVASQYSL